MSWNAKIRNSNLKNSIRRALITKFSVTHVNVLFPFYFGITSNLRFHLIISSLGFLITYTFDLEHRFRIILFTLGGLSGVVGKFRFRYAFHDTIM